MTKCNFHKNPAGALTYFERKVRDNPIDVSRVELETRNAEHAQEVKLALEEAGYHLE